MVGCSENDKEQPELVTKKETNVISIDGTEYSFNFTEDAQGNITLEKGQEKEGTILSDYYAKHPSASSYYDENSKVVHLFKNSDEMITFMSKKASKSAVTEKKSNNFVPYEEGFIKLLLYEHPNFVNLLNFLPESTYIKFTPGSLTERGYEIPDLSRYTYYELNGITNYMSIDDQISSIKLSVGSNSPVPHMSKNFHQCTVVFYEARNFGGYSFGMSLNTYNSETSYSDLAYLRMYKSWINGTKNYDNRISSYIMNQY